MEKLPAISDSEWVIMKLLWEYSPRTANELVEAVAGKKEWKPKTVKTLINRLVTKGYIRFEKEGKLYHYFPGVHERECRQKEQRSFLEKVYDGSVKPLLASLIEDEQLSDREIDDLLDLLHKKKGE